MGRDEWKTNSLPEIPAACGNKREIRKLKKKKRKNYEKKSYHKTKTKLNKSKQNTKKNEKGKELIL